MVIVSIIVFIFIFALIVWIHELGHFLAARRMGVGVEEFAFGFPPRLFSLQRGQTIYAINAIPLGGYVKLKGEDLVNIDPDSLGRKSPLQKAFVMVAGVTMNALLAWLVFMILLILPPAWKGASGVFVASVQNNSAASTADFKVGDIILQIDNRQIHSTNDLHDYTASHQGQAVSITLRRYGVQQQKTVTLRSGNAPLGVGVNSFSLSDVPNPSWWQVPWVALQQIGRVVAVNVVFIANLIGGLIGIVPAVSTDQVSGPIGIYALVAQFVALGWVYVLIILAQLSLAIAVFNILPFPALDGGRLIFLGINKVLGKKKLSQQIEGAIHALGFALLMGLFVIITWHDIVKLIK